MHKVSQLKLRRMGDPKLYQKSLSVTVFDQALLDLVQALKAYQAQYEGVGIAAPQLGINQRVIVFGFENNSRYPDQESVPVTVLINPEYEVLSDQLISEWEGCLSVPKIRGLVARFAKIRYWGKTEHGVEFERVVDGFHARVVQHEVDHLDGILFPSRVSDLRYLGFEDVLLGT